MREKTVDLRFIQMAVILPAGGTAEKTESQIRLCAGKRVQKRLPQIKSTVFVDRFAFQIRLYPVKFTGTENKQITAFQAAGIGFHVKSGFAAEKQTDFTAVVVMVTGKGRECAAGVCKTKILRDIDALIELRISIHEFLL